MKGDPIGRMFTRNWQSWPLGQSTQPEDDSPVLRSVDSKDVPGRLPTEAEKLGMVP